MNTSQHKKLENTPIIITLTKKGERGSEKMCFTEKGGSRKKKK